MRDDEEGLGKEALARRRRRRSREVEMEERPHRHRHVDAGDRAEAAECEGVLGLTDGLPPSLY